MPSRRKSPRKSSGKRPVYYGTDGDQDSSDNTTRKAAKPPSKYPHKIGYKGASKKSPPPRKKSTKSSSESSSYEDESESEGKEKGLVIDMSKKKTKKMVATRSEQGRREGRTNDDEDVDDVENETSSPELAVSKIRGRIWDSDDDSEHSGSRINEKKRKRDDDDDSEQGGSRINEMRKKEDVIAKLKRTIKTLEMKMKDMQRTSSATSRDKMGWKGEELIFVKNINDFCRDRLYPKEKFLRKNWQEYLPYDTRSLYSVCMKHLSIPRRS